MCTCKPASTIKVGDKVKIVRKVESHTEGWENSWVDSDPLWLDGSDYRIKPEPTPDIVYIQPHKKFGVGVIRTRDKNSMDTQRIKWTIDGESGRIKSVEILDK